jgi:hypothetical protein
MRFNILLAPLALAAVLVAPLAPAAPDEGAGADCVVKGKGVVEKGVYIYSAREGGTPIAGFATQEVSLELSDVPADVSGRAKVKTGKGSGSVRIEGWVDATKIPLSARSDIAIVPQHVWIGRGEPVKLKKASPGKMHVSTTISATQQTLTAKASCGELTVGRVKVDDFQIPSGSKKYVLKKTTLDLFDDSSGGSSIFTIEVPTAESGVLLYSSETKGGYTRVQHGGSFVVDAWAKTADLKLFPKGEMLDQLGSASMVSISPAKLKVEGSTKEVKVSKDVSLRLSANEAVKPIGVIEDGADVIVVDTVGEWSRVFPKGLEIIPPDGKDFWVKAKDLQ